MALPGLAAARACLVEFVALVETAGLLARCGKAARLAVLVNRVDNPVDAGITADGGVLGVDENNLKVLVGGVLVDPVRVQDAQIGAAAADTLLGGGLERALVLELVHTLVGGLAESGTLADRLLAATAADAHAVDNIALLGLVAETAGLVWARRARSTVDDVQLTVLQKGRKTLSVSIGLKRGKFQWQATNSTSVFLLEVAGRKSSRNGRKEKQSLRQ